MPLALSVPDPFEECPPSALSVDWLLDCVEESGDVADPIMPSWPANTMPPAMAAIISAAPAMDHSTMARLLKCRRRNSRDADVTPFVVLGDGGFADDAFGMGGLDWENSAWRNSWTLCGRLLGSNAHA